MPDLRVLYWVCLLAMGMVSCTPDESPAPSEPAPNSTERVSERVDSFDLDGFKATYENTDRVVWQRPNLIIGLLGNGDLSKKTIADIGSGPGFFAKRITPLAQKVIALDIDQNFLDFIDSTKVLELATDIQPRLETRLTPRDAPRLSPKEVDAVLIVNTFMYIDNKLDYLQKLKPCIKEGGRLVIVDFKRKRTALGPRPRSHRAPLYQVEDLLHEAGYRNIQAIDTELNYQYILIAEV